MTGIGTMITVGVKEGNKRQMTTTNKATYCGACGARLTKETRTTAIVGRKISACRKCRNKQKKAVRLAAGVE